MGRTKHGLPPRSKSEREFDHEIGNVVFVLNALDAGRLDHLFVDAETKAAVIPNPIDQNPWAHWRSPMDMMRQG